MKGEERMNTSNIKQENQEWERGIVRISLTMNRTKRLKWFWNYVIRRKPLFVEITFMGRLFGHYDAELNKVFYISPVSSYMALMENFKVTCLDSNLEEVYRVVPDE